MRVKNRNLRPQSQSARAGVAACVQETALPNTSFQSALRDCAQMQLGRRSPFRYIVSLLHPSEWGSKSTGISKLACAWEWMHAKYTLSATKRLRVSETVALGEKRFVAIVSVEGREFLIGGGTAGISLLAHLGLPSEPETLGLQGFGKEGGTR